MSWRDDAACHGRSDIDWFPTYDRSYRGYAYWRANKAAAQAVCADCPVRSECLAEAMADPLTAGIWAGTTESQRRRSPQRVVRRPQIARCGTDSGYRRHRAIGETPCQECRAAHAMEWRIRKHRLAVVR